MAKSKKDIDKDIMYSKIMPSTLKPSRAEEPEEEEEAVSAPAPVQAATAPAPVQVPATAQVKTAKDTVLSSRSEGVQINTAKGTEMLVNLMEQMVVDRLDAAFDKFKCCRCDKCKKDVAAIALNKLNPRYVVTTEDRVEQLSSKLPGNEAATAIVQAILQVRAHPRH